MRRNSSCACVPRSSRLCIDATSACKMHRDPEGVGWDVGLRGGEGNGVGWEVVSGGRWGEERGGGQGEEELNARRGRGHTTEEKGTRLARAECNDSLERRGREREGRVERVQRVERWKDDASSALDSRASFFFFSSSPTHPRCEHLFAVYEIEGTSDTRGTAALRDTGNANKVHSVGRVSTGCRGLLTYPYAPFLSYNLTGLDTRCSGALLCKWEKCSSVSASGKTCIHARCVLL